MKDIELDNGKYTLILDHERGAYALRYGKPWRNLVGDNLVLALAQKIEDLQSDVESYRQEVAHLEELRPYWAQGHSSDSIAAQCATSSLIAIRKLLGVEHQTDTMAKLRELLKQG